MRALLISIVITFVATNQFAMAGTSHTAASSYPEVASYELDVIFDPPSARMSGNADIIFREDEFPLAKVTFYLHGELQVDSLRVGNQSVNFTQRQVFYEFDYSLVAREVTVDLSDMRPQDRVTVIYGGYCHPSKAGSPSNYMRIDESGVYLRSYGYSLWFPVFLPPRQDEYQVDFSLVTISTPADFPAVFTGRRLHENIEDNRRVSTWEARGVSIFDAQCSARRWDLLEGDGVLVYHLPDAESHERADGILRFAQEAIEFFGTNYRPGTGNETTYIMQLPQYGDISSGNVSGISDDSWLAFDGDWVSKYLLAHEIVHHYTGGQISRNDPMWCFVVEGFPSYFHLPFLRQALGAEWYKGRIETVEQRYLKKRDTGLSRRGRQLPPEKPIVDISADELSLYKDTFVLNDRVVLFFDFLLRKMGEGKFLSMCRDLFEQPSLSSEIIQEIISAQYEGPASDIETWLSTTEFTARMQIGPDAVEQRR